MKLSFPCIIHGDGTLYIRLNAQKVHEASYNALYFKDLPFPQYMSRVAYEWGKNKWELLLYVKL